MLTVENGRRECFVQKLVTFMAKNRMPSLECWCDISMVKLAMKWKGVELGRKIAGSRIIASMEYLFSLVQWITSPQNVLTSSQELINTKLTSFPFFFPCSPQSKWNEGLGKWRWRVFFTEIPWSGNN